MTPRCLVLLAALLAAPILRAHDEHLPRGWVEPGRDHWVTSPVDLKVSIFDASPKALGHLKPGSLVIRLNGIDVTAAFLAWAQHRGKLEVVDHGNTFAMTADKVPLAVGVHEVKVSYTLKTGHKRSFAQSFRVYDPLQVKRGLGLIKKNEPLSIETNRSAPTAPPIWLTPFDKGFVHTATTDLEVRWTRGNVGMQLGALKVLLDNVDVTAKFSVGRDSAIWKAAPVANGKRVLVAQVADHAGNLSVATSTFIVFDGSKRKPWLYAPTSQNHPYAHAHQQFQNYGSGQSSAYFHHGSDINRPSGSRIYACEGGRITSFYWYNSKPLYFEVGITDADGFEWQYHHVDEPKIPTYVRQQAAVKGLVPRGTDLGANVHWPVKAYGRLFHHIHLNVLAPDGRYINLMNFVLKLNDTVRPTVSKVYITQNGSETVLNTGGASGATVGGKLDFVARAEDLVQGEPYQLTVYRLTYQVTELSGNKTHHVPETDAWKFDYLPGGSNRNSFVWDTFRYRLRDGASTLYTRGDYTSRIFYHTLTNRTGDTTVSESKGYWDSARKGLNGPLFPNGQYRVTVRAYDIAGNLGSRAITFNLSN